MTVFALRIGAGPEDVGKAQFAVEMREQLAATGRFPFQFRAKRVGLECENHEIARVGEVLGGGFCDLGGGREMYIAIRNIYRRAIRAAIDVHQLPFGWAEYLENEHGSVCGARVAFGQAGLRQVVSSFFDTGTLTGQS